jgi:hypothetical protein
MNLLQTLVSSMKHGNRARRVRPAFHANGLEAMEMRLAPGSVCYCPPCPCPPCPKPPPVDQGNGNNGFGQEKRGQNDGPPPGFSSSNQNEQDNPPLGQPGSTPGDTGRIKE